MQFSPTQSMYAPTAQRMARPPAPAPNAPAVPPQAPAPRPSSPVQTNALGVISTTTKDGLKAAYSPESMSFKLTDNAAGVTLFGFGTNAFAIHKLVRDAPARPGVPAQRGIPGGISAAVSPTNDVIIQVGQQTQKLGNLTDPQTVAKLGMYFSADQCRDLLTAAQTHDLARTSLGQRVMQNSPDWLKSVHQRQMFDPRVLGLPKVQQIIARLRGQSPRSQGPQPRAGAAGLTQEINDTETELRDVNAMTKSYHGEPIEDPHADQGLGDAGDPPTFNNRNAPGN